jgi:hypothetical protein
MRLRLRLPADAVETVRDDATIAVQGPSLRLLLSPLVVAPEDRAQWIASLLAGAPVTETLRLTTELGWPLQVHVLADRLIAAYEMLGHVAAVNAFLDGTTREALLPLLTSAYPDWRGRVPVALSELWSLDVTPRGS